MKISTIAILLWILNKAFFAGFMTVKEGGAKISNITHITLARHDNATMTELACHHAHC